MFSIVPHNLHWLSNMPAAQDLCAHGGVLVTHDREVLIDDREQEWALSASAVFLLRTLVSEHMPGHEVGEQLFPCCGHGMFVVPGSSDVAIVGCNSGRDWQVLHRDDSILLLFGSRQIRLSAAEWRVAVLSFSDAVEEFYARSEPKKIEEPDERAGFEAFRAEWARRRDAARRAA